MVAGLAGENIAMAAQVQILLSTWNGENWLQELLASLLQQTTDEWELLIRDDGSQDQTCKLLLEWPLCPHSGQVMVESGIIGLFSSSIRHTR